MPEFELPSPSAISIPVRSSVQRLRAVLSLIARSARLGIMAILNGLSLVHAPSVPPYPNDPSPNNQPHHFYSGQRNRSKSKRFLLSNSTPSFSNKRCCKASPPLRERA